MANKAVTKKKRMRFMATATSFVALVSFIYKLALGIYGMSLVLIIASFSSLMVFICKFFFVRNVYETRAKKKKVYLFMILSVLVYSLIFLATVVLKIYGIDISEQKSYTGLLGSILIGVMIVMFVLSIIKLRGALEKSDLMVIGLKEMIYVSALADFVIIENYIYGMYTQYRPENVVFYNITKFFPLGIGVLMLITTIFMFVRYFKYEVKKKEETKTE